MRRAWFCAGLAMATAVGVLSWGCQSTEPMPPTGLSKTPSAEPSPTDFPAEVSCGETIIRPGPFAGSPPALSRNPWAIGSPSSAGVTAYFWGTAPFLAAGQRPGGMSNKILWAIDNPTGRPLRVVATPIGKAAPRVELTIDPALQPAGNYPSTIDLPLAGCWHLEIHGAREVASIDVLVS